ncbi:MAG: 4Fe-4S dicluster domain-containing protein [Porticoccaceae bacterium]|nr:respiratory nitrate reductase subunit beta [Pseudomonadales bacterium]
MSKRQIAMVMDLNKCLGCHTCSIACKTLWTRREGMQHMWWNTVNTQPGTGTPHGYEEMGGGFREGEAQKGYRPSEEDFGKAWDFNYDEVFHGGKEDAFLQANYGEWNNGENWKGPNWDEDIGAGEYPNSYYFYLPRICNHCTHPACLEACPRKAIEKREEDGIVLINEERCSGYRFCQEACPYKKIYFNETLGKSQKCIFCFPRIDEGVTTACSRQCPGRLRFVGYLDDPEGPIYKLVHEHKVALPLHSEYGTQPNVYYVPPISSPKFDENGEPTDESRIPLDYLEYLFGPSVKGVLDKIESERVKVRNGGESELMDLLIARKWLDLFGPFTKHPRDVVTASPVRMVGLTDNNNSSAVQMWDAGVKS